MELRVHINKYHLGKFAPVFMNLGFRVLLCLRCRKGNAAAF